MLARSGINLNLSTSVHNNSIHDWYTCLIAGCLKQIGSFKYFFIYFEPAIIEIDAITFFLPDLFIICCIVLHFRPRPLRYIII